MQGSTFLQVELLRLQRELEAASRQSDGRFGSLRLQIEALARKIENAAARVETGNHWLPETKVEAVISVVPEPMTEEAAWAEPPPYPSAAVIESVVVSAVPRVEPPVAAVKQPADAFELELGRLGTNLPAIAST